MATWLVLAQSATAKTPPRSAKRHRPAQTVQKVKGETKPDMEARTLVRRMAPFLVEEKHRGETIQINKDGTFSLTSSGKDHDIQGHWKVIAGKLRLKWTSGEEHHYSLTFSGKTPLLVGQKARSKGHYVLNTED